MATTRKAPLAEGDLDVEIDDDPVLEVSAGRNLNAAPEARRRGRPANSDGLTRQRILSAARECFAESGYVAASTHMVAGV